MPKWEKKSRKKSGW